MIVDLHVHTKHYSGCSSIEAESLISRASEVGLDGGVITEHGILWHEEALEPLRTQALMKDILLLAGQEISCFNNGRRQGDFLVYGVNWSLGSNLTARDLVRLVHDEGGVVAAAHPYRRSRLRGSYYGVGDEIYDLELDALELWHLDHDEEARRKVQSASRILGIPMTGGSDAHELYEVGSCFTRFLHRISSLEDLISEIRRGRIEPLNGISHGK